MSDSPVRDQRSGRGGGLPRGIESIVALAAAKPAFRERFAQDRNAALTEEGIELTETERALLDSISDEEIFRMADRLDSKTMISKRGLVTVAAALAVLGGVTLVSMPNYVSTGISPEEYEEIRVKHEAERAEAEKELETGAGGPTPTPTETPVPDPDSEGGR